MVNVIWNIILSTADTIGAFLTDLWNTTAIKWENDSNNWES